MKQRIKSVLSRIGQLILVLLLKNKKFCVLSNDCWGGELYRWTKRPYNTPFVGLMLMAPCYIDFLQNPKYYLSLELKFIEGSKYTEMNKFWAERNKYPIGILDNIEIHFLHYKSSSEAEEKWNKRKKRIDWDHLCVKFSMDKDFASAELLRKFDKLPFQSKISLSRFDYHDIHSNLKMKYYDTDGANAFRLSLMDFNLIDWIKHREIKRNIGLNRIISWYLFKTLKRV